MKLAPNDPFLAEIKHLAQKKAISLLQSFIGHGSVEDALRIAFGTDLDTTAASSFISDVISGREHLPVEIVDSSAINGAYGAFDHTSETIYLSKNFLLANNANPSAVAAVLLEEMGHQIDARYNPVDTPGDEGEIFAHLVNERLVPGTPDADVRLAALRTEDDHGTAAIDGNIVELEYAAPNYKVGIVYSATTAAKYFSTMAYSQLFMAVQNQAAEAGIPYDLLTEADLTNLAKLAEYNTLIFPSFSNVPAAKVAAITDTLTTLVKNYHVGLITAGNFMTNDENGAALSGNAYARMETLLDIKHVGDASGVNVNVVALSPNSTNPMMAGYANGEVIHQYTSIGTSYFSSNDGLGAAVANQVVNGQTYNAVIATQTATGGRNTHFATEGIMADNNMLAHALDWTTQPASGPDLSLHISRDKAIVAARVDMDTAMYIDEVHPDTGQGIYDKLLPILTQWKQAYNFVGSFYIDIGNNPNNGETTGWAYSKTYYNKILALGNEIGSHSLTHPDDTNLLTAAQIQSEFQTSRQIIEQQLGLSGIGVAVPGNPETLATARQIEQYYPYMTGGASMIGFGYPGAIGYLSPSDMNSVYIAPNTSFDYTFIGWQKLTAAQAEAAWAKEWTSLTAHGELPVIVWPWHDYGATASEPGYTTQMYTNFIAHAAQAGSEFVTLADLAQRVSSFEKSSLSYTYDATANAVTATTGTTGTSLGKFALDLGTGYTIKSVSNWYAYDTDSVFVAKTGGTYTIALGGTPDDVTHITALPDRSELLTLSGDGTSLNFSIVGEGHVTVDLKDPTGKSVVVSGADSYILTGDKLDLAFTGLGQHNIQIVEQVLIVTAGTAGDDTLTGTANADTMDGGAGNDTLIGGAGNDTLNGGAGIDTLTGGLGDDIYIVDNIGDKVVEAANEGTDTVQSSVTFTLPANVENLILTGSSAINGTGNDLGNAITGNSAANTLDGGTGTDTLTGGAGDDIYIVDNTGDQAVEVANEGTDMVRSSVTFTLGANVENLTLTGSSAINGTGNALANVITGNSAANSLSGGTGNDTLNGGAGADTLTGGAGDDIYIVDNTGDQVVEAASAGTDTVQSSVTLTLAANVENLTLVGSSAINGTGNALANVITGNSAANTLSGAGGADKLEGLGGNDTLTGGAGADQFIFNKAGAGVDIVTDFTRSQSDKLVVHASDYTGLSVGSLNTDWFESNATGAVSKTHAEFIYNTTSHTLMWDADGTGVTAAVSIATLSNNAALNYQDFLIIA